MTQINLDKYDVLVLSSYKRILAEDKNYIALEIWEHSKNPRITKIKTFKKIVNCNISKYVIRNDNRSTTKATIKDLDVVCWDLNTRVLAWLYNTGKQRIINGKKEKSLQLMSSELNVDNEIAKPVPISKVSGCIKDKISLEEI